MKTIGDLRKEFEEIEKFKEYMKICYFDENLNIYKPYNLFQHGCASYLNGGWFMFQEFNK